MNDLPLSETEKSVTETAGINIQMEEGWKSALKEEFFKPYFQKLTLFLKQEKASGQVIYPPGPQIFSAFNTTPFESVKVVILGQDPYHGPGQAHGLCFSVPEGIPKPPSLVNIFKELNADLGLPIPQSGNLTSWARQGVFLLNAILTVRAGQAASHQNCGWQEFTNAAIKLLSERHVGLVFLLWGRFAQEKESLIDQDKHFILKAAHPSPLSAHQGFFGSRPFSKTNEILKSLGRKPVDWKI